MDLSKSYGETHKVFEASQGTAACFQHVQAQAGYSTLRIELAKMQANSAMWNDKWAIDVAKKELHAVASVLCGFQSACHFKFHGATKNHSYSLMSSPAGVVFEVQFAGPKRSILLGGSDVFWIAGMVIDALSKNMPAGFSANQIMPLLQRTQFGS